MSDVERIKHKFNSNHRLLNNKEFKDVTFAPRTEKHLGKRHSAYFVVFFKPVKAELRTFCRLGVTVSKRVSKKAVIRNAIKRRIKEAFREHKIRQCGYDIVFIAKPIACENVENIYKDVNQLLNKLYKHTKSEIKS